jgi:uncharacterized membrane protein/peptidoglycan hydrolase-like protein with peptidoglycan-binding domain
MFIPAQECHRRSVFKAVSWRALGSLDTFVVSYFITGSFVFAGSIASAETVTKVFLYYLHERAWSSLAWGQKSRPSGRKNQSIWARLSQSRSPGVERFLSRIPNVVCPPGIMAGAALVVCFALVFTPSDYMRSRPALVSAGDLAPVQVAQVAIEPIRSPVVAEGPASQVPSSSEDLKTAYRLAEGSVEEVISPTQANEPVEPAGLISNVTASVGATVLDAVPLPPTRTRSLSRTEHAEEIQQKLASLGYFTGTPIGIWGPRSRDALRAFKEAHDLGADDTWDEHTEALLFSSTIKPSGNFVATWAASASACPSSGSRNGSVATSIRFDGAQAADTACAFENVKRTSGGWSISGTCSNGRERWKTNVRLVVDGNRLTWTSQRGTQNYVRCGSPLQVAGLN